MFVCVYVCSSPHLPRFQVCLSKSRLFCSQSIDSENPGDILSRIESHVFASEEYELMQVHSNIHSYIRHTFIHSLNTSPSGAFQ